MVEVAKSDVVEDRTKKAKSNFLKYAKSDGWSCLKHWSAKTLKYGKSDGWSSLKRWKIAQNLMVEVTENMLN